MSLSISSVISLSNSIFVVIGIVFAFLCFIGPRPWRSNSLPYPPGPPGDPFIGNIRQISAPGSDLEQKFEKWGKQYGLFNSLPKLVFYTAGIARRRQLCEDIPQTTYCYKHFCCCERSVRETRRYLFQSTSNGSYC
jgi:hypothetical protein